MPAVQTTYGNNLPVAYEGMPVNMEPSVRISRVVESAAGIGFGKVGVRGAADDQVRVSEASRAFEGITIADPGQPQDSYAQYATAALMRKGVIWVSVAVTVTKGEPAYYVPATGVITNVTTSNTAIAGATFDSSGTGLVKLRLG